MNRFTNNLYDSEIGGNIEESTLGLSQYGGFINIGDTTSSIEKSLNDTVFTAEKLANQAKNEGVNLIENGINKGFEVVKNGIDKGLDVAKNVFNQFINGNFESIEPLMTVNLPNQTKGDMTNSQRLNYQTNQTNQNNLGGSATISLYNNLNKIVGGCDCKKQYCGGFNENETSMRSNTIPDSDISSTEEIINKINQITTGGCDCNKQYCGGADDDMSSEEDDMPSEEDDFNTVDFDLEDDFDYTSEDEDDEEVEEFQEGGAKSNFIKPGFSNFINGLYKECKMKGGKKKFNPEAVEWNKKTNEFIQTNFKIDDWDKIKIIKFVANTKNKKEIGEDKLKALSDVERAKMLYNTVSSMKPAEIKKIDFKKIQAQRVKILKEKFGDKYKEPKVKEEPKKEKETKKTTKKTTKKGGYDNLFLGGEDSESIRLPGGFRY